MARFFKNRNIKKKPPTTAKIVPLGAGTPKNKRVEIARESVCGVQGATTEKLLEYCCKKIASKYTEWERNSK